MPEGPIGIVVVDDNELIGEAVERWFRHDARYRFLGACTSAEEAMGPIAALRPGIVLMDVDIPGSDPLSALVGMVESFPGVRFVVLSGHVRPEYIERSLDAGAAGYIVKDEDTAVIIDLILRAAAGEVVLSPAARESLVRAPI
jgi:two-component system response regulator DegU